MNSRRTASVLLALSLLAACGGGGGDEEAETTTTAAGATTTAAGSPDTGFEIPEVEFEDADFRVRFVNVFSDGGADSEVDFSWGNYSARSDAASLGYGEASEMLEGKVPSQTLTDDPEEGKVDMGVVAQRSGAAEDDQPIMSDDEIVARGAGAHLDPGKRRGPDERGRHLRNLAVDLRRRRRRRRS
jgi:hypothetical protein